MKNRYYLAYGSNLNVEQMRYRCPHSRIVGTAEIPGYELLFKGSKTGSYLTIEKKPDGKVPVAVWLVTPEDELALDRYEGAPTFYYKTEMKLPVKGITSGKVRNRTAFVYIMHEDRKLGVPRTSYVRTCLDGYQHFGFDINLIMEAISKSTKEESK